MPENFKDTWKFAGGVNYQYDEKVVLRGGLAYEQSPVNDTDRGARLPDNDRVWLTAGARYKYSTALNFDVGAAYIFVKDGPVNIAGGLAGGPPDPRATGLINGEYNNRIIIVSAQANYRWK